MASARTDDQFRKSLAEGLIMDNEAKKTRGPVKRKAKRGGGEDKARIIKPDTSEPGGGEDKAKKIESNVMTGRKKRVLR